MEADVGWPLRLADASEQGAGQAGDHDDDCNSQQGQRVVVLTQMAEASWVSHRANDI